MATKFFKGERRHAYSSSDAREEVSGLIIPLDYTDDNGQKVPIWVSLSSESDFSMLDSTGKRYPLMPPECLTAALDVGIRQGRINLDQARNLVEQHKRKVLELHTPRLVSEKPKVIMWLHGMGFSSEICHLSPLGFRVKIYATDEVKYLNMDELMKRVNQTPEALATGGIAA